MEHFPSKRAEIIFESTTERVAGRVEELAESFDTPYQVAFKDGCAAGVLEFLLLNDDFKIATTEQHEAFVKTLLLNDNVLTPECCEIIVESGADAYIRIEPRKTISQ